MPLLEVDDLHVAYGELEVVKGISLAIEPGEIVTVLGSNGAGKTTTLRSLAALMGATKGRIAFSGRDIGRRPPHEIADLGLVLVPEGRQLFPEHTVRENLELGAYRYLRRGRCSEFAESLDEVCELFPRVRERLGQTAGLLSGGEQQMVAISRALVSRPRLLLLDEPSLGLAPILLRSIFDAFVKLKARGLTLLIVEQMAWLGLEVIDRAYVLENGLIALSGTSAEVASNPR
jgi:branched-chain amino acid transport system ATP-binding protein